MVAAGARVGKNTTGDKDDFEVCEKIIKEKKLGDRVKLIPFIPEEDKRVLLNAVDIVISPNVKTPGTMEGFGINVIEASVCGRVVVASAMEGLLDAVQEGKNGFLVEEGNVEVWVRKVSELLADDGFRKDFEEKVKKYTVENYSWEKIAKKYLEAMKSV